MHKIIFYIATLCCLIFLCGCAEENQPPVTPEVVEPAPGSIVPVDVTLRWICEDPDGDMLTYDVYLLSSNPTPAESSPLDDTRTSDGQIADWYKPDPPLYYGREYIWCITAWDSVGEKSAPLTSSFTTESRPPPPPKPDPVPIVIINEGINVPAWQYHYLEISLEAGWQLSGLITSDTPVNIWLLEPREFEAFKNGETFHHISAGSRERTLGFSFIYDVPKTQKYYFVVDNKFSWITSKDVWVYLATINKRVFTNV